QNCEAMPKGAQVHPGRVRRHPEGQDHRQPLSQGRHHVLCRAGEPHDADVDAAVYPADERFLEETRKPRSHVALYALWHNFVRMHKTLRMSLAMAAGIQSRL